MDLMPTFAAMTGARLPADLELDGYNMLSLMTGDAKTAYSEFYYRNSAVRSGDWKYYSGRRYGNWCFRAGKCPKITQKNSICLIYRMMSAAPM